MDQVRFGIIGMGIMGTNHASWLRDGLVPNGTVRAVCDIQEERRQWSREHLPNVQVYTDYRHLLKDESVDAVIIATPHYFHPTMCEDALDAGLHVLSEKPAGVYTKSLHALYEKSRSNPDLVFGIMLNERTNPVFKKAKELCANGSIGKLRRATWISTDWWRPQHYYDSSDWRGTWNGEGGGVLINQGPHQIDLMQWICGMPNSVWADLKYGLYRDVTVEDDASVHLKFDDGATGTFIICTNDILGTNHFEIFGDRGKITIEDSARLTARLLHEPETDLNHRLTFADVKEILSSGRLNEFFDETIYTEYNDFGVQHHIILQDFCQAVLSGSPLYVPGTEGINSLMMSNAMHLSSWLNQEINLPLDEDRYYEELQKKITEESAVN